MKRQKLSILELEDLSDEIILNVLGFLDIKNLLRVGHVSNRLRAISKDETLWQKINLHGKCVPTEFLEMVLENGCKYLKLSNIKVEGNLNLKGLKSKLKYLHMEETGLFSNENLEILLQSCHSLQKLQMFGINQNMVESICLQNGKTLEVLDLSRGYGLRPEWIELITRHCVNLKEANFNYYGLKEDSINYLVKNLTTKIERLCLSCAPLKDEQVKVLVSRCNKISVLDLTLVTSITDMSIDYIIEHLKSTLEELDVQDDNDISCDKLLQLRSMHRLKILNLLSFTRSNVEEFKRIQRAMPHVEISDGTYFKIVKDTNRIWEQSSSRLDLF